MEIWMGGVAAVVIGFGTLAIIYGLAAKRRRQLKDATSTLPRCQHGAMGRERRGCRACLDEVRRYLEGTTQEDCGETTKSCIACGYSQPIDQQWFHQCFMAGPTTAGAPEHPAFRIGRWVRLRVGVFTPEAKLGRILSIGGEPNASVNAQYPFVLDCGHPNDVYGAWSEDAFEQAIPMEGEYWNELPCSMHHMKTRSAYPTAWGPGGVSSQELQHIECGCLVPLNYGKG